MNISNKQASTLFSWLPVLLCMSVIFLLSSQPAQTSNRLSKNITKRAITTGERIGAVAPGTSKKSEQLNLWNNRVRDYAHSAVFFALALAVFHAARKSSRNGVRAVFFTLLFCMLYALLDEFHQSFVPGRGVQLSDFIRDCAGAALGVVIYSLTAQIVRKWKRVEMK